MAQRDRGSSVGRGGRGHGERVRAASRRPAGRRWALGFAILLPSLLLVGWLIVGRPAPASLLPALRESTEESSGRAGVAPIPWPDLDGLGEADRQQLQGQREILASAEGQPDTTIGFEQGTSGQMLLAYGFDDAARVAFGNAIRLQPADPRWPYFLGILEQASGDPATAATRFERVLELEPGLQHALVHLAEARQAVGQQEAADALLARVLEQSAEHPTANFLLGLSALDRGDARAAAEHFETVLAAQPGASSVYNPLAQAYRQLGDAERAEAALARRGSGPVRLDDPWMREVIGLRREAMAILSQGSSLAQQGRLAEALAVFEQAVAADPQSAPAQLSRASTLGDLGRVEEAIAGFYEALALDPSSRQARVGLAVMLDRSGDTDAALEQLDATLEMDARDLPANQWKGMLLRRLGRCDEAVPSLDAALAGDERDVTSRLNLIVCRASLGQHAAALERAEEGHRLMPESAAITAALVRLLAASPDAVLRDGPRALELAQDLVEAERGIDALEVLAMALAELGRFDAAVEVQSEAFDLAAERPDRAELLEWMAARRDGYAAREPSREPWPPAITGG